MSRRPIHNIDGPVKGLESFSRGDLFRIATDNARKARMDSDPTSGNGQSDDAGTAPTATRSFGYTKK